MNETTEREISEREIQVLLLRMGIPTNLLGFLYLVYAVRLSLTNFRYITHLSKHLYVDVAEKYQTDAQCVERCIRHALAVTFSNGLNEYAATLFGADSKAPTNTQFITRMYFYLISEKEA